MAYKDKMCKGCSSVYVPLSGRQLYCPACGPDIKQKNKIKYNYKRLVAIGKIKQPGVGHGNYKHSNRGTNHPLYKTGEYCYDTLREDVMRSQDYLCASCKIDVRELRVRQRHIHHIDHDRLNYSIDNLVLLCAKCHIQYHKSNRKGSETIPKGSRSDWIAPKR